MTTTDIITEAAIFISIYLVANLSMALRSKATVVGAFSSQLPVIVAPAIRLYHLHRTISSPNPSLDGAYSAVATQWQLDYAIMSSTISSLGPFLRPFSSTSYRHTSSATSTYNGTQACTKSAHAFQLSSLQSATRVGDAPTEITDPHALRPDRFAQEAWCWHERSAADPDQASLSSSDSKRLIITKKTMWSVEHDRASVAEAKSSATTVHIP